MTEWLAKFFSGFALWRGAVIGKVIYFAVLFLVFMMIYNKFTAKETIQNFSGVEQVIIENEKKEAGSLALKLWKVKLGVFVE